MEENTVVTCAHCGVVLEDWQTPIEYEGETYCEECATGPLELTQCDRCGEWEWEGNLFTVRNEGVWCGSCVDDFAVTCECCDHLVDIDETSEIIGGLACQDCLDYNDDIVSCAYCEDVGFKSSMCQGEDGDWYCPHCWDTGHATHTIYDYHCGPELEFYGMGGYHMGVELEIDGVYPTINMGKYETAELVVDIMEGHVYCSNDGSLDNGFEIVTHPHTYEEMMGLPWGTLLPRLVKAGWRGHDTTTAGLHVHIGREAFDDEDSVARFCTFFEANWDFVRRFSRRADEKLEKWAGRHTSEWEAATVERVKEATKYSRSRYRAVNLNNDATVEVRIFRSTLKVETLLAAIEFVNLLAMQSNALDDEEAECFTPAQWLMGASDNLIAYCETRGIPIAEAKNKEEDIEQCA